MSPEEWTALATVVIAVFTVILALSGGIQAWLTRRAILETNKQHIVSNRASVFLKHFLYMPTGSKDAVDFWRITPVFENSGKTATKRMLSGHSAELRQTPLPADFDYPDIAFPAGQKFFLSRDIIGPNSQLNGAPYILSIADVQAIARQEKRFYVWGWSDYSDTFEGTPRHRTEYCFQLVVLLDPTNPKNTGALAMGQSGPYNGIDEQCMRDPGAFVPA